MPTSPDKPLSPKEAFAQAFMRQKKSLRTKKMHPDVPPGVSELKDLMGNFVAPSELTVELSASRSLFQREGVAPVPSESPAAENAEDTSKPAAAPKSPDWRGMLRFGSATGQLQGDRSEKRLEKTNTELMTLVPKLWASLKPHVEHLQEVRESLLGSESKLQKEDRHVLKKLHKGLEDFMSDTRDADNVTEAVHTLLDLLESLRCTTLDPRVKTAFNKVLFTVWNSGISGMTRSKQEGEPETPASASHSTARRFSTLPLYSPKEESRSAHGEELRKSRSSLLRTLTNQSEESGEEVLVTRHMSTLPLPEKRKEVLQQSPLYDWLGLQRPHRKLSVTLKAHDPRFGDQAMPYCAQLSDKEDLAANLTPGRFEGFAGAVPGPSANIAALQDSPSSSYRSSSGRKSTTTEQWRRKTQADAADSTTPSPPPMERSSSPTRLLSPRHRQRPGSPFQHAKQKFSSLFRSIITRRSRTESSTRSSDESPVGRRSNSHSTLSSTQHETKQPSPLSSVTTLAPGWGASFLQQELPRRSSFHEVTRSEAHSTATDSHASCQVSSKPARESVGMRAPFESETPSQTDSQNDLPSAQQQPDAPHLTDDVSKMPFIVPTHTLGSTPSAQSLREASLTAPAHTGSFLLLHESPSPSSRDHCFSPEPPPMPRESQDGAARSDSKLLCSICRQDWPTVMYAEHTDLCMCANSVMISPDLTVDGRLFMIAQQMVDFGRQLFAWHGYPRESLQLLLDSLDLVCHAVRLQPDRSREPQRRCQEVIDAFESIHDAYQHEHPEAVEDVLLLTFLPYIRELFQEKREQLGRMLAKIKVETRPLLQPKVRLSNFGGSETAPSEPSEGKAAPHGLHVSDFEVLRSVSRGAYGRLYLARLKRTGELFAIKVLRKSDLINKNAVNTIKNERNILAMARNPFVVRFYYSFDTETHLFVVMEWCSGGDLYSLLLDMGCLDEDTARVYIAETVLALEYCHSLGVIHRDVKPDNLLIAPDGHIKLADFGLSVVGASASMRDNHNALQAVTNSVTVDADASGKPAAAPPASQADPFSRSFSTLAPMSGPFTDTPAMSTSTLPMVTEDAESGWARRPTMPLAAALRFTSSLDESPTSSGAVHLTRHQDASNPSQHMHSASHLEQRAIKMHAASYRDKRPIRSPTPMSPFAYVQSGPHKQWHPARPPDPHGLVRRPMGPLMDAHHGRLEAMHSFGMTHSHDYLNVQASRAFSGAPRTAHSLPFGIKVAPPPTGRYSHDAFRPTPEVPSPTLANQGSAQSLPINSAFSSPTSSRIARSSSGQGSCASVRVQRWMDTNDKTSYFASPLKNSITHADFDARLSASPLQRPPSPQNTTPSSPDRSSSKLRHSLDAPPLRASQPSEADRDLVTGSGSNAPVTAVGTPDYLAPEQLTGAVHTACVDWWSLGCVLFEFCYGVPPFHADTPEEIFTNILNQNIQWPQLDEDDVSDDCRDLIKRLLHPDPWQRLGANSALEIKLHPWFKGIDWESLIMQKACFIPTFNGPDDTSYFKARKETSLQSMMQDFSTGASGATTRASGSDADNMSGSSFPEPSSRPSMTLTRSPLAVAVNASDIRTDSDSPNRLPNIQQAGGTAQASPLQVSHSALPSVSAPAGPMSDRSQRRSSFAEELAYGTTAGLPNTDSGTASAMTSVGPFFDDPSYSEEWQADEGAAAQARAAHDNIPDPFIDFAYQNNDALRDLNSERLATHLRDASDAAGIRTSEATVNSSFSNLGLLPQRRRFTIRSTDDGMHIPYVDPALDPALEYEPPEAMLDSLQMLVPPEVTDRLVMGACQAGRAPSFPVSSLAWDSSGQLHKQAMAFGGRQFHAPAFDVSRCTTEQEERSEQLGALMQRSEGDAPRPSHKGARRSRWRNSDCNIYNDGPHVAMSRSKSI